MLTLLLVTKQFYFLSSNNIKYKLKQNNDMCTETININCRLLRAVYVVGSYCDGEDSIYVQELPQMYTLHQLLIYLKDNFNIYEYLYKNFDGYEYRN